MKYRSWIGLALLYTTSLNAQPLWQNDERIEYHHGRAIIENSDWLSNEINNEPYFNIGAQYGNGNKKNHSIVRFNFGAPIEQKNHIPYNRRNCQQAYQDGYHAGFQAALRSKNNYQNNNINTPYDNEYDGGERYSCIIKINSHIFEGRGLYRDSTKRQAYQNCRQIYSNKRCRQARVSCQNIW